MEAKGSTFLKVTGILMIVFGAIALIVSIIAILGIAALAAFNDGTYDMTMLYVGGVFALISAVAEFVAGIIGVINAKLPHKANTCIVWGVVVAVMCIAGEIISMIGGSQFNVFSLICGLSICMIISPAIHITATNNTPIQYMYLPCAEAFALDNADNTCNKLRATATDKCENAADIKHSHIVCTVVKSCKCGDTENGDD